MYTLRRFAVRHSRLFERVYSILERTMVRLDPVFAWIGYNRVERPAALVEKVVKGLLFDCRMCGQCVLSSTGMSCPMNCPKQLRNGPCGGVRPGGYCEVKPDMICVWCEAWEGAARMRHGDKIHEVLPPVDRTLRGSSSWLRVSREIAADERQLELDDRSTLAQAFPEAREMEPAAVPLAEEPEQAVNREQGA